jgi:hypothetical protein
MLSQNLKNLTSSLELARSESGMITLAGAALDTMINSISEMRHLAEHFESMDVPESWRQAKRPFNGQPVNDNIIAFPVIKRPLPTDENGGVA